MLLFIKKNYQDMILNGQKTIEIKAGKRFRAIKPGQRQCINGWIFVDAIRIEEFSSTSQLFAWANQKIEKIGFASLLSFKKALNDLYGDHQGPFFAVHLNPQSISVRSPKT
jgi:ASC-1-like (ASCH) protein